MAEERDPVVELLDELENEANATLGTILRPLRRLLERGVEAGIDAERERQERAALPNLPPGLFAEYGRLDVAWQELVRERDDAVRAVGQAQHRIEELEQLRERDIESLEEMDRADAASERRIAQLEQALRDVRPFIWIMCIERLVDVRVVDRELGRVVMGPDGPDGPAEVAFFRQAIEKIDTALELAADDQAVTITEAGRAALKEG